MCRKLSATLLVLVGTANGAIAQEGPPAIPAPVQATPYHLEVAGFYSAASRGYGDWRGLDLKFQYASRRVTPFVTVSRQTRSQGSQQSVALGSYITLNDHTYMIAGISHAPDRGVVLYPRTRLDAALFGSVRSVRGLVMSAGITEIYGANQSGGRILSLGSIYYHGRMITSGGVRFNRDRLSGAASYAEEAGFQYGQQGRYWIGGGVTHGTEAYQVVAAIPFDARFEGVGASAFVQRWTSGHGGVSVRYDFEHKYTAYVRNSLSLTYFIDF